MGCDIHIVYEAKGASGSYQEVDINYDMATGKERPLDYRSYGLFAFLADVRNYSAIKAISPQRGIPDDASAASLHLSEDCDFHSQSNLTLAELLAFDYEQVIEDRRSNGSTVKEGLGESMTYREFLFEGYFKDLKRLSDAGVERICFAFDN